jgi:hypothetical protein
MDHWNSIHPDEEPIQIPMDLTLDIEWRKNAPDEDGKAGLGATLLPSCCSRRSGNLRPLIGPQRGGSGLSALQATFAG